MLKNPSCPNCQSENTWADTHKKMLMRIKICAVLTVPFTLLAYYDFRTIWVFLAFWCLFMVIIEGGKYKYSKLDKHCCKDCKYKWNNEL